jgi:hypothetical protein
VRTFVFSFQRQPKNWSGIGSEIAGKKLYSVSNDKRARMSSLSASVRISHGKSSLKSGTQNQAVQPLVFVFSFQRQGFFGHPKFASTFVFSFQRQDGNGIFIAAREALALRACSGAENFCERASERGRAGMWQGRGKLLVGEWKMWVERGSKGHVFGRNRLFGAKKIII